MSEWVKPTGEGPHERPRIFPNHLGPRLSGTVFGNGECVYGWWACYYDKGMFAGTFKGACRAAAYLGGRAENSQLSS
jgi:hypothetical protein